MNGSAEIATMLLPETLEIAASEAFLEQMRKAVAGDQSLRLDASAVKSLTLPCVQIIMAAIRTGDSIKIKDPSEVFAAAFEDLGLDWMQYIDHSEAAAAEDDYGSDEIAEPADLDAAGAEVDSSANTELQPTSESVMSKRILTIDDSKTMRDMLMLTLAEAGFDVIQAVDGQDGLDVLGKEKEQIDVIITDINMPRMDGYEVIRNLRRDPAHKSTPILVLTTESDTDKKNLAREAGATGWMVKPFDPERLVATVRKVAP
jgi:two-component system, chemotaxis family, chemotaxis protein CheY